MGGSAVIITHLHIFKRTFFLYYVISAIKGDAFIGCKWAFFFLRISVIRHLCRADLRGGARITKCEKIAILNRSNNKFSPRNFNMLTSATAKSTLPLY